MSGRSRSEENLIPFDQLPEDEMRELKRRGGIASGEARRRKRTLREELLVLLETNEWQEKISLAMLQRAANGSERAFEVIRDTIGEKPTDRLELEGDSVVRFAFSDPEDDGISG